MNRPLRGTQPCNPLLQSLEQWKSLSIFICPKALWLLYVPNPWLSALTRDIMKNINSRRHFEKLFLAKPLAFARPSWVIQEAERVGAPPGPWLKESAKQEQNRSCKIPLPAYPRCPETHWGCRPQNRVPCSAPRLLYTRKVMRVGNIQATWEEPWRLRPEEKYNF